jgi:hypothetical protein
LESQEFPLAPGTAQTQAKIAAALRKPNSASLRVIAAAHGVAVNTVMRIAHAP